MATGTPCSRPWTRTGIVRLWPEYASTSRDAALTCCHRRSQAVTHWPCWRSCTVLEFHGPPRDRAGAQGRRRSAERRRERGSQRRSLDDHHGARSGAPRRDTVPPFTRRDAWSRGCDASAGTFQEGWQRFGGAGAARREPTAVPRPSTPRTRARLRPATAATRCRGAPARPGVRHGRSGPSPKGGTRSTEGPERPRLANSPAQLAHQHASGLAADPPGRRRDLARCAAHQRLAGRHRSSSTTCSC